MDLKLSERLSHYEALEHVRKQLEESRERLRESRAQVTALRCTLHRCGFDDAQVDAELERAKVPEQPN